MKNQRSFSGSFQRVSQWENCSQLAHHYRGAMREVVSYLDLLAANDEERFVFCSVDNIANHCEKYQSKQLHGKRWVQKVLAELRRRHFVSGRLVRVRRYEEVTGFIVAPHSCLTQTMPDGTCIFRGPVQTCGRWERTGDAGPDSVLFWAGCGLHSTGVRPVDRPLERPLRRPLQRPLGRPPIRPLSDSAQPSVETKLNNENAGLTVLAVGNEEPKEHVGILPALPAVSTPQNQQRQAGPAGILPPSSSSPSKTTPTPRQRFLQFIGNTEIETQVPDTMRCATPKEDEFAQIVEQLEALGDEELASIIYDWEEQQSPPIATLKWGRWTRWLETGKGMVAEKMEDIRIEKEYAARRAARQKP
jgi:hypothetical protein